MSRRISAPQLAVLTTLGPATILAAAALVARPEATGPLAAGACSLALIMLYLMSRKYSRAAPAVSLGLSLLILPELALRLVGFGSPGGMAVHFGWPRPQHLMELQPDPETFWTLPPSSEGVNRLGLAGSEPQLPKPPGRTRVVLLGDSVTQFGLGEALQEALQARDPSRDWDTVNLGVVGYTAVQGRIHLERWLPRLEADLVLVGFGWNDHWLAPHGTDLEQLGRLVHTGTSTHTLLSSLRLLQLRPPAAEVDPYHRPRVWPHSFQDQHWQIEALAEGAGASTLVWSLPSSHHIIGVPEYLVAEGFAASSEDVLQDHAAYAQHLMEFTSLQEIPLVHLLAEPMDEASAHARFLEDGIHLTDQGRRWAAARIAEGIVAELSQEPRPRGG